MGYLTRHSYQKREDSNVPHTFSPSHFKYSPSHCLHAGSLSFAVLPTASFWVYSINFCLLCLPHLSVRLGFHLIVVLIFGDPHLIERDTTVYTAEEELHNY